jgi:hypothetical protein
MTARSPLRPRQSTSTKSSQLTLMLIWIWEHLLSTARPCSVTTAGLLVIRCLSTPPSPSCLKTTSPWLMNARTLPCTPACKHQLVKFRLRIFNFSIIPIPETTDNCSTDPFTRRLTATWTLASRFPGQLVLKTPPLVLAASTVLIRMLLCVLRSTTASRLALATSRN